MYWILNLIEFFYYYYEYPSFLKNISFTIIIKMNNKLPSNYVWLLHLEIWTFILKIENHL